ncbi:o-succinylbenzoate synthase [Cyanobium sp. HWJ4-Hawea]|uniref:o-succinylbenzoate synthase n=1 Tax=Cyanobium sp. HWJ4-Hawea TaxID=2823713 RepID=UPI0020CC5BB2|nr:o-succinylbenzoate synthase [Cyanobium sp. HWJ4-Hawea]MCP9808532.1 o-succinylbenzoate synthase [Cyanobium sp. HWJ4-Hawea]
MAAALSHREALIHQPLRLAWRPYGFELPAVLVTAHGAIKNRRGWLLRLEAADGRLGWGELVDWQQGSALAKALQQLPALLDRAALEDWLTAGPAPLAFALGSALAELDGAITEWLAPPASAHLLPAGPVALGALETLLARDSLRDGDPGQTRFTVKWKVAAASLETEFEVLTSLLACLPPWAKLRLDANGGWDRASADQWASRLGDEPRLEWLEQPLAPHDQSGLEALARRLPVALDESLRQGLAWAGDWQGWQVRRPSLEGDPRPLLAALQAGQPHWMVSTALETGIGRRWLHHLAALQIQGPTPTAPGLAPGWCPEGPLFATDPEQVWEAAG